MTSPVAPPPDPQSQQGHPAAEPAPSSLEHSLNRLKGFAFSTLLATVAKLALRVGKNVLLTRILGPEARGIYGLLNTIPGLFVSFGNLGFGLGSLYLGATKKESLKHLTGNAVCYAIVQGAVLACLALALHHLGENFMAANRAAIQAIGFFILFGIPLTLSERLCNDLLMAARDIHFLNLISLMTSVAPMVVLLVLWPLLGDALAAACWSWLLSMLVVSVMTVYRLARQSGGLGLRFSLARQAIGYGLRGNISQFAGAVTRRVDLLLLAHFLPAEDLGQYAAAVSLAEMLLFLPEAVSMPFMPLRMEMALDEDQSTARAFSATIIKYTVAVVTPMLLVTALLAKPIILVLYGRDFLPSLPSLILLLPGIMALAIYQLIKADLYSLNRPGLLSWINVGSMLLNLGLNLIAIPLLGIAGAALTSSICYTFSAVTCLICFMRITGARPASMLLLTRNDFAVIRRQLAGFIGKKLGGKKERS
ncbi:oligosaccharide flippase family protein [Megalodesulfovibrio paquesii]